MVVVWPGRRRQTERLGYTPGQ